MRYRPWYVDDEFEGGRYVHVRNARGRLVVNVVVQITGYKGNDLSDEYARRLPEAQELARKIVALANGGEE